MFYFFRISTTGSSLSHHNFHLIKLQVLTAMTTFPETDDPIANRSTEEERKI
jgi:hypothetical protein